MQRDEPIIESRVIGEKNKILPQKSNLKVTLKKLLKSSLYGVLATQYKSQPYTSLLAYAFTGDLRNIIFVTPQTTRKYKLLNNCKRVAFQVDNRGNSPKNIIPNIIGLTIIPRSNPKRIQSLLKGRRRSALKIVVKKNITEVIVNR